MKEKDFRYVINLKISIESFVQRPRRVGAKFTGEDIKPDEILHPELDFDYDGKRDRFVKWLFYSVFSWYSGGIQLVLLEFLINS